MSTFRQSYYNFFSKFYDNFIKLHSGDNQEILRQFFVKQLNLNGNEKVLDICCGTGATTYHISNSIKKNGIVVGLDFSIGMIEKAKSKYPEISFIVGDVSQLPFKENIFDRITCTFAFYELKGDKVDKTLKGIISHMCSNGQFFIMEHEIPEKLFIRFLFYIRIMSMGFKKALTILKNEKELLEKYFSKVVKIVSPSKNSKIWKCYNHDI